jgi:hypothetical protein
MVGTFFVVNSATQFINVGDEPMRNSDVPISIEGNKLANLIGDRQPVITPSIYLLIYDAYVPNETMQGYGIDNSAQEEYLKDLGFTLYPHTYSKFAASIYTMTSVLDVAVSSNSYALKRHAVSGDGVVDRLLKDFGYETIGLFPKDYFFQGIDPSYDYSFPPRKPESSLLIKAIFMGEFRFDVEFNPEPRDQFLKTKLSIFETAPTVPRFVYMHSNLPAHSQNSGNCLPNETDLFRERLESANIEMRNDLSALIENDPTAILIVAGDHGPYLTKSCVSLKRYDISKITRLDIQDRFGTFLAIKWPSQDFSQYDQIMTLQDLFPAVLSYLFKDQGMLEAKIDSKTGMRTYIGGAEVENGIILGGVDDGEPLFLSEE